MYMKPHMSKSGCKSESCMMLLIVSRTKPPRNANYESRISQVANRVDNMKRDVELFQVRLRKLEQICEQMWFLERVQFSKCIPKTFGVGSREDNATKTARASQ